MPELTDIDIRAHLDALAVPPCGLGELRPLAERLCSLQQTLAPAASPRRLVLFAADHGPCDVSAVAPAIGEIASGGSAVAVLARATATDLVLVDVGSCADALRESATYRCRKVRAGSCDVAKGPALTADEFRAAVAAGRAEAERAAKEGQRLVAADALGNGAEEAAARVGAMWRERPDLGDDPVPALAAVGGADLAAAAGFFARAAELGLAPVACGDFARLAARVADLLWPGTSGRALDYEGEAPAVSSGLAALLLLQRLDAAAAVAAHSGRRTLGREQVVPVRRRKVAIFTGSFDPPTTFHRRVVMSLRERGFDEVIVRPTGPRHGDGEVEHASPIHRAAMADLAFRGLPGVTVDLSDLDDGVFTPPAAFEDLHADRGEVWHVVSDEFVAGGHRGESAIHAKWEMGGDMWAASRFVVLHPRGCEPDPRDRPPASQLVTADGHVPTYDIRLRVFQGGTARPDVPEAVEAYVRRYGLFSGKPTPRETRVRLSGVRLKVVYDERNEKARGFAEQFRRYESPDPTHVLVLGGDGTMLQAIRDHWRLRLPFVGLNAGTLGFLMNESLPVELDGAELVLYRMPMLRVDTELGDGRRARSLACADAWVERDSGQAAWLRVDVDGRTQVPRVVGDGLLVATPSGSSAYARAMGATPVPLTAPVLTLAGSNVFRPRFWRPVTLPESAVVSMTSLDHNGKRPIRGFIDGRPCGVVRSMDIRASSVAAVELAFTPEFDLSARLLRSMFPPSDAV
jgi:NAD kinase/NaMN:DMB phosphoribosyltransferase